MTGTRLPEAKDTTLPPPRSRYYTDLGGGVLDVTELNTTPFWAAGAMTATADDLNRFFAALLAGRLLPPPCGRG
ncbi:MAG: hypothetical protein M3313_05125 [Actinomycetota bacterium]|nr:hypothetical protein [Actinomycetota bacterium]